MANGKIRFGKQSGGELAFVFPDGVDNTEVIFPESGDLVNKDYVDSATVNLTENQTIEGTKKFTSTIDGSITGNAGTAASATSAAKWTSARTITMSGDVAGSVSIDGSANVTLAATVANDSHTHAFANLTGKPTTLQGYGIEPEEMSANINLDTKTITGVYFQNHSAEATVALKYPVALAGLLEVFAYSDIIHQRYWAYNSDDIYYRSKHGAGAWIPWTKGANVNDTVTAATKLETARTINGVGFDGSANITVSDATAVKLTGNETIAGVKTFSSNIVGNITGNSGTATKLATARTINGVGFDGSTGITISDSTAVKLTGNQTVAGVKTFSSNIVGNITGNSGTATKLATARSIALAGDVTGSATFDGGANISITATVADNSHNHTIENITSLQATLNAKANLASPALTGVPTAPTAAVGTNNTQIATTAFVLANGASVTNVKTALNASGSAPIYACRAWVHFNGTGTVAINSSGNVSSITDNGVGDYTANFTTAMPSTSYASLVTGCVLNSTNFGFGLVSKSAAAVRVFTKNTASGNIYDANEVNIAITR